MKSVRERILFFFGDIEAENVEQKMEDCFRGDPAFQYYRHTCRREEEW
jgi:hypothetical protein